MHTVSDERFDALISRAMDELPQEYIRGLDNVVITYADEPDAYRAEKLRLRHDSLLLGLYEGIPLTERGAGYTFVLPDKITLFKYPLLAVSGTDEELFEQIKRTLWHEMAHFYGLGHDDMDQREAQHRPH